MTQGLDNKEESPKVRTEGRTLRTEGSHWRALWREQGYKWHISRIWSKQHSCGGESRKQGMQEGRCVAGWVWSYKASYE